MRLICPNCGAQYAVDDRVIPTDGRDVQCSACGHTWFQVHPKDDLGLAEELSREELPADVAPPVAGPSLRSAPEPGESSPEPGARSGAARPPVGGGTLENVASALAADTRARQDRAGGGLDVIERPDAAEGRADGSVRPDLSPEPLEPPRPTVAPEVMNMLREEAARERRAREAERSQAAGRDGAAPSGSEGAERRGSSAVGQP